MNGNSNEGRPDKGRTAAARKRAASNIPAATPSGGTGPSLQAILDALPDILFVVDREGRIYHFNAPNSTQLYVPPAQFLGQRMKDILPEPAASIVDRAIQKAAETGHHHGSVYSLPLPGGERWFEMSLSAQGDMQTPEGRLVAIVRDITARKQAEQDLRDSREYLATVFNSIHDALVVHDAQTGAVLDVNQRLCEISGYTREEVLAHGLGPLCAGMPPYTLDDLAAWNRKACTEGPQHVEFLARHHDGHLVWVEVHLRRVQMGPNDLLLASVQDITQRKTAEAALRDSEEKYRALTESMKDVVWVLDIEAQRFLYVSPSVTQLRGYTPEEILARPLEEAWAPAERPRLAAFTAEAVRAFRAGEISTDTFVTYEMLQPCQDGSLVPSEVIAHLVLNPHTGRLEAHGVTREIQKRKRMETELRASEERFAQLARQSRTIVWEVDTKGLYTYINPVVEEVLGYRPDELIGIRHFYDWYPEESRETVKAAAFEIFRQKSALTRFENQIRSKDGRLRWLITDGFPLLDEDGQLRGYRGSAADITERKETEAALHASEARFATATQASRSYVWEVNPEGLITFISPMVAEVLGRRPEDIVGRLHFYDLLPEEDREEVKQFGLAMMARREAIRGFENRNVAQDGRLVWLSSSASPLFAPDGTFCGYQGIDTDITARKETEAALKKSEARFAAATTASRSYVWQVDPDGVYTFISPVVEDVLGYRPEEIIGKLHFYDILPEEDREETKRFGLALMARHESINGFENRNVAKDGRTVWVVSSASPIFAPDGTHQGYQGIDIDITERKRAEEALQRSESQYRLLYENMRDAFVFANMEGQLVECNPAFEALLGYRRDEIVRLHFRDITPAKWRAVDAQAVKRVLRDGTARVTEKEYIRKDGTIVPVEMTGTLIRDPSGRPAGIAAIIRDISERKRAERELQQAHDELEQRVVERTAELESSRAALAQSEEQFRQMAESIEDMFWLYEVQTRRMLYVSPVFEAIWGVPLRKLKITPRAWLATIHPDDRQRVREFFTEREGIRVFPQMEYRVLRPDGSIRWVSSRSWEIRNAKGKVYRIAGVVRDITSQRRMEAEILNAAEEERLRIGRDLHDSLGQALTGIGYLTAAVHADLARKAQPEAAEVEKLARLVGKTAEQAHDLSRGLLLTDLKRGGLVTALQELAHHTQALYPLVCRYTGPAETPLIDANAASNLYRIAQEAITNAVKHSRAKTLTIHLDHTAEGLLLAVKDTGRGLAGKKSHTGGLGLDIMRYRAGLIGATLWIDSARNGGTTVNCLLPVPATKRK